MSYQSQAKGDKLCIILIILNYQLKIFKKIFPIAGGYVNLSFSVDASNKKYFLKLQPNTKSNFFDYELSSLKELTDKNIGSVAKLKIM